MQIAFIGLGVMGGPMAANLLRAGHTLRVCDLDPEKRAPLTDQGAAAFESAGEAVSGAEVIMTSLPGPAQVRAVALAEDGVLARAEPGALWVELSTNNLEVGREVAAAAEARGLAFLDAPVSGGDEGAAAGNLTILAGGAPDTFARALPLLQVIGERIEHLGPAGAGYAAKIAQVVLCYVHSLALSEALMLGVKGGVAADKMLEIIQNSTGSSYVADRYGPPILNGDYDPSFTLGLALKDMKLAGELAAAVDARLPLCDLTTATYAEACAAYGADSNHLMAVRLLEEAHETPLRAGPAPDL